MHTPADAARRTLLGTGLGLLVVTGLLLSLGLLPPTTCDDENSDCIETGFMGWGVPTAAALCLAVGFLLQLRPEALSGLFPTRTEAERATEIDEQAEAERDDSQLGGAWATLEQSMLSSRLEEE